MGTVKKKFFKILSLGLFIILLAFSWLAFGDRGLIDLYSMEMQRKACIERIEQLSKENQALHEELKLLSNDMEYVETLIRRKLNLVKENEVLYRFNDNKNGLNKNETRTKTEKKNE